MGENLLSDSHISCNASKPQISCSFIARNYQNNSRGSITKQTRILSCPLYLKKWYRSLYENTHSAALMQNVKVAKISSKFQSKVHFTKGNSVSHLVTNQAAPAIQELASGIPLLNVSNLQGH